MSCNLKTNNLFLVFVFVLFCFSPFTTITGQPKNDLQTENITLLTGRTVYCVTEWIHFSATPQLSQIDELTSKVIYLELISPVGKAFLQKKYPFSNNGINDSIYVPKEIISGNYYLRVYTKWMRNFGPKTYRYNPVKIINPFKDEILDQTGNISGFVNNLHEKSNLVVETNREEFLQNETIELKVSRLPNPDSVKRIALSVIHSGASDSILENLKVSFEKQSTGQLSFLPETRGISLSGIVLNKADSTPLPYSQVNLTVIGDSKKYLTTLADSSGKFYFALPKIEGMTEVFITAKSTLKIAEPIIFVENDFCTQEIELPFIPFEIKNEQFNLTNNLSINAQITDNYKDMVDTIPQSQISYKNPFYGKPTSVVELDDYIAMNNLDDYFKELITNVKLYKKNGIKKLKVEGVYSELEIYEPLVMVDFIPIYKIEAVMNISPKMVNKIDVVAKPYILGNMTYGGIIHVLSKNNDFAGVDLPSTGQFFKIQNFEPHVTSEPKINDEDKIPSTLNCLFWTVLTHWKKEDIINMQFTTGNSLGDYQIVLKYIDINGREIITSKKISIKK